MGFLDAINHLLNFVAPAGFVALCTVLVSRFLKQKQAAAQLFTAQLAINFVVTVGVLLAGLWYFQRDGKMATYLAMVVASGTVQWWLLGLWRK